MREERGDYLASSMQMTWVLCGESEEHLNLMVGRFAEICSRRDLKVNTDKSKVMMFGGEEGLEGEIRVELCNRRNCQSSNIWGTEFAECRRYVVSLGKVAGAIRSLITVRGL